MAIGNYIPEQRNQATRQLEEELQFTKFLMDRAPDAVFWVEPDARFWYVNHAACCMAGYSRNELLSMTMYDIDPDLSPKVWLEQWRIIKQQGTLDFESQHQTKEGWNFSVESIVTYVEYCGREYGCIFVRDISKRKHLEASLQRIDEALECKVQERTAELMNTNEQLRHEIAERKRVELELEKSLSLLHATLESTVDGVITIKGKGEVVNFNQIFVKMWQVPEPITMSRNHNQWLAFYRNQLKDPETFFMRIQELDSQSDFEGYDTLELKNGRVFEHHSKPQRLGEKIVGRVWSFRDITERRQPAAEIHQALEKAKQLSALKTRFVSIIAHELRTPLNIISFSTSLLRRHSQKWTEEKKLQYLDHIQTAVEQLSQLLNEVLFLGKAEAEKLKFQPRHIDLAAFCCVLVAQMQLISNSSKHTITFVSQGNCSTACVDKNLLQPILTNLLSNAVKYSPPGSIVKLELSCLDGNVIFQIKDVGIGISAADRQRLFEPFYRGSNVGDIPGTGLGLAVVEKLVDIHGGQITIESEVGVGTTFKIMLPSSKP